MSAKKFKGAGEGTRIITATSTSPAAWQSGGTLERIIINVTLAGTVSIRDEANGTTSTPESIIPIGVAGGSVIEFGLYCSNGLTVTTSSADDITVIFAPNE